MPLPLVMASRSTSTLSTDFLREVGRIGRAHGVQGELYVSLVTDRVERLAPGARVLARSQWLTVIESRPQQQRWLVPALRPLCFFWMKKLDKNQGNQYYSRAAN